MPRESIFLQEEDNRYLDLQVIKDSDGYVVMQLTFVPFGTQFLCSPSERGLRQAIEDFEACAEVLREALKTWP